MAANAVDLTTAAAVAADLGVSSSARIETLVTAVSRAVAQHCNRVFEKKTGIIEYPRGYGRPLLMLARTPILAITSIVEMGSTVDSSTYEISDAEAGLVLRKSSTWAPTAFTGGRVTDTLDQYIGESGTNGLTATYDAGYVTPGQNALDVATYPTVSLPEDVQEAAKFTAVQWYRTLGVDLMVAAESIGDWSVTYFGAKAEGGQAISPFAKALLAPYARYVI
jgi:hypothetical protein